MNDEPLFKNMDDLEKTYAPQQLPPDSEEQKRVRTDEGGEEIDPSLVNEPPSPAPVANVESSPSSLAAPPNIGHEEHGGAPGDPNTQAGDPLDADDGRRTMDDEN